MSVTQTKVAVGAADDFDDDSITAVTVGDQDCVLIKQGGEFYALPDRCTHAKYPLRDGELLEGRIRCIHHGATYDLETGAPTMPAFKKIRLFDATVEDGTVYVSLQEG